MASAVDSTAIVDDEPTSNTLKRRRSSGLIPNESDIEQMPFKPVFPMKNEIKMFSYTLFRYQEVQSVQNDFSNLENKE